MSGSFTTDTIDKVGGFLSYLYNGLSGLYEGLYQSSPETVDLITQHSVSAVSALLVAGLLPKFLNKAGWQSGLARNVAVWGLAAMTYFAAGEITQQFQQSSTDDYRIEMKNTVPVISGNAPSFVIRNG